MTQFHINTMLKETVPHPEMFYGYLDVPTEAERLTAVPAVTQPLVVPHLVTHTLPV